ncbi:MAG TPA: hypothetical protein VD790_09395 [Thermoleophilaceae bacterium]|nr:hypothetical protein [Thermoleophilaceae bacterium]
MRPLGTVLACAVLALAACGDDEEDGATTAPSSKQKERVTTSPENLPSTSKVRQRRFVPARLGARPTAQLTIRGDRERHRIAIRRAFPATPLPPRSEIRVVAPDPGIYRMVCTIHPEMRARILVG